MLVTLKPEPDIRITNSMHNLAGLIERDYPGWCVNYSSTLVPCGDLREFFLEAKAYTRSTFAISKYGLEMFVHIDFKKTTEVYVIQRHNTSIVSRRLYTVSDNDNVNLFHIITTELTGFLNGYEQTQAGR